MSSSSISSSSAWRARALFSLFVLAALALAAFALNAVWPSNYAALDGDDDDDSPPQHINDISESTRQGIHRFDATYAFHLASTVHAPMAAIETEASTSLPLPNPGRVTYLGVPATAAPMATTTTTVFEHRPFLASGGCTGGDSVVLSERPMVAKRLAAGSQHRIVVQSPLYLAQFDSTDRRRILTNCARWLHPSQGVLILSFLDGGEATKKWCTREQQQQCIGGSYKCEATLERVRQAQPPNASSSPVIVCHLHETITGGGDDVSSTATTTYSSLVFADAADPPGWSALVKRAGLKVVHALYNAENGVVTWVCRPSS